MCDVTGQPQLKLGICNFLDSHQISIIRRTRHMICLVSLPIIILAHLMEILEPGLLLSSCRHISNSHSAVLISCHEL
ncbi:hypothetical protein BDV26DRAFT_254245 [Aspergillus bertholletiae]|uniref:Uncharacterized protein n=1 Tax=Aspergillus bertholletiae TaxID=1226010 RepID=A0A5N7BJU7_9EURO|nr:hypothetical protein BDV26DRAFT_254245 [Aspergillus bertholletiae]